MSKTKRRRIQRDPQIQKRHRERFLAALASGSSPTRAAKQAGIGRSTLYEARRIFFTARKLAPGNKRTLISGCCALSAVFQFDYGSTRSLMIGLPVVQSNTAKI